MIYLTKRIIKFIKNKWTTSIDIARNSKYIGKRTQITFSKLALSENSSLIVGKGSNIKHCQITLENGGLLIIKENVCISNAFIHISNSTVVVDDKCSITNHNLQATHKSHVSIGKNCFVEQGNSWYKPEWIFDNASANIADNNLFRCDIWARFSGKIQIGSYNCINERTQIRADELVKIGSYNMISYDCRIWDTDTHSFYEDCTRRDLTKKMFPIIGAEIDKPITKPCAIGDDNLIGEAAVILKGSSICNGTKIGTRAIISNVIIPDKATVVQGGCRILCK